MEITLLIMEKSWNCVFEFLWEPCLGFLKNTGMHMHESRKFCQRGSNFEAFFLAHLSRRLMGELIVYQSLRRPSVRPSVRRPSVRQHFQTSSPLKPLGQLNSNFIWRLLRTREQKFVQMVLVT